LEPDDLQGPFQPLPFYESMILFTGLEWLTVNATLKVSTKVVYIYTE